jgi:predicted DsbA family dithiol-disulfide isomerase
VRTDRLQREQGVELRWRVFPLHPETPQEGTELSQLLGVRPEQVAAMQARLLQVAVAEGLPLAGRSRTYNSRGAQELGKWAEALGTGDPWRRAVYRAFFTEGRNIALGMVLEEIAAEVGLSSLEAREVLAAGSYGAAVEADWQRAEELGVTAVPTHLYAGKRLVGFSGYEDFLRLIGKG